MIFDALVMEIRTTGTCDFDLGNVDSDDSANISDRRTGEVEHVERRRYRRIRTYLTGVIIDGDLASEVIVLNVSANGARLRLRGSPPKSPRFSLKVKRAGWEGTLNATLRWRDGNALGVQFDESPEEVGRAFGIRLLSTTYGG